MRGGDPSWELRVGGVPELGIVGRDFRVGNRGLRSELRIEWWGIALGTEGTGARVRNEGRVAKFGR